MRIAKRLPEFVDAQTLRIKCMYRRARATAARRVRNDYNAPKANDAEGTVSVHVCNDVKLYRSMNLRFQSDEVLLS